MISMVYDYTIFVCENGSLPRTVSENFISLLENASKNHQSQRCETPKEKKSTQGKEKKSKNKRRKGREAVRIDLKDL
jgi:hypothetical protein